MALLIYSIGPSAGWIGQAQPTTRQRPGPSRGGWCGCREPCHSVWSALSRPSIRRRAAWSLAVAAPGVPRPSRRKLARAQLWIVGRTPCSRCARHCAGDRRCGLAGCGRGERDHRHAEPGTPQAPRPTIDIASARHPSPGAGRCTW